MKAKVRTARVIGWRFYGVLLVLCALSLGLVWHLAGLQVLPGEQRGYEFLQRQGLSRTLRTVPITASRGLITDRHGEPLAVSTPVVSIWAHPEELLSSKDRWAPLTESLGLTPPVLEKKLRRYRGREFVYLRRHLTPEHGDAVLGLAIPGVYGLQEYRRFYPAGEVTAHLVGFTNVDDQGQEGMELGYNQWLTGQPGEREVFKDPRGRIFKIISELSPARDGNDMALSIDLRLQYLAYRELKAAVLAHKAKSGSIVLLDARTGEVLAMVNQPSYNPNDRGEAEPGALRNRAMIDRFEPGSTMKPLTIMAALEAGAVQPETEIDTHPGRLRVGRKTLLDPVNYGIMSVARIVQKSSQVGLTKISLSLPGDSIRDLFSRVGVGEASATGFPGEVSGLLPQYSRWQPIVQANFAFGYGLSVTPLQLARVYSVIANHGVKRPISLLRSPEPTAGTAVVETAIARQVAQMLESVVEPAGTGTRANIPAYQVAGKTGTIHKVGAGGYADDRYISLFAGFAPAEDPRVIAVVVIHEPGSGQYFGGEVAAPVFARLVERSLRLLRVPPTRPVPVKASLTGLSPTNKAGLEARANPAAIIAVEPVT